MSGVAGAGELDPGSGRLVLSGVRTLDLEGTFPASSGGFEVRLFGFGRELDARESQAAMRRDPHRSLVGGDFLSVGGEVPLTVIELEPQGAALSRRRVEVRIWQKAFGTQLVAKLVWHSGDFAAFYGSGLPYGTHLLAEIPLFPTGRVTSDGWRELSSGAVDFWLAARIRPLLVLEDQQLGPHALGQAAFGHSARAAVDGLELLDHGPAEVPVQSCHASLSCGPSGACLYGRCVDAAARHGPNTPREHFREYLSRMAAEYRLFSGSRASVQALASVVDRVRALDASGAAVPELFAAWRRESRALADGHYNPRRWSSRWPVSLGVCTLLGRADLSEADAELPLVYDASAGPLAGRLQPGDALTAIEGQPPLEWLAEQRENGSYNGDPRGAAAILAMEVIDRAAEEGARMTFSRCSRTDVPCSANEREEIEVSPPQHLSLLWAERPPDWRFDYVDCDARPRPAVAAQSEHYDYVGWRDEGSVRLVQINGVSGSPSWSADVDRALAGTPSAVLLDQRRGLGGTIDGADTLAARLVTPEQSFAMELLPALYGALGPSRSALRTCTQGSPSSELACGNAVWWQLGFTQRNGRSALGANTKIAVLNYLDVSGNDYVSELLRHRGESTRIFGPGPTYGAFGAIVTLPTRGFELEGGGSLQIHDTLFLRDPADENEDFTTGRGVEPTVRVLQKQSDLVRGVDTALEEAKRWLRE